MNEEAVLIDLIKKRRSVRAYTHEPVNKKDISDILSAAAYTPSAFHAQPWRVYALTGRAKEEVTSKVLARLMALYLDKSIARIIKKDKPFRLKNGWNLIKVVV